MKKKNSKKPFFASFLEKQVKEPGKVKGGGSVTSALQDRVTLKYPSDSDEALD